MKALHYPVVFAAAFVAGMAGALPVFVMGLVVSIYTVWPLTLGTAAVAAAVVAGWSGNLLSQGHSRSRLLAVVGVSETTAVVLVGISLISVLVPVPFVLSLTDRAIYGIGLVVAIIALSATAATGRFREEARSLRRDALLTLALLVLAPVVVAGAISLTCGLDYCGA